MDLFLKNEYLLSFILRPALHKHLKALFNISKYSLGFTVDKYVIQVC